MRTSLTGIGCPAVRDPGLIAHVRWGGGDRALAYSLRETLGTLKALLNHPRALLSPVPCSSALQGAPDLALTPSHKLLLGQTLKSCLLGTPGCQFQQQALVGTVDPK